MFTMAKMFTMGTIITLLYRLRNKYKRAQGHSKGKVEVGLKTKIS